MDETYEHVWFSDIARVLDSHLRDRGYKIPTRNVPAFVLRLVAIFDKTARLVVPDVGLRMDVSCEQAKRVLGWKPRSFETMITYAARASFDYFRPKFSGFSGDTLPPIPGAAQGRDATDFAINFHVMVGWAF
jgi:hypothetical protein